MDPYTKEDLGFILFNISVDKLKTLWSDSAFSENTNFYLIDEADHIVHSIYPEEIGLPAAEVLGSDFQYNADGEVNTQINRDTYMISSSSSMADWKAVTVIPKKTSSPLCT